MPKLEITELVLVRFNLADNNYQHNSRFLHSFIQNK